MSTAKENLTEVLHFNILGFPDVLEKRILLFSLLLSIYVITLSGNLLIIIVTKLDSSLQNPMFIFLGNLSLIDICYISVTVPQMLITLASNDTSISFAGCMAQLFSMIFLEGVECILLAIMAYDRYAAICKPLYYALIMDRGVCYRLSSLAVLWGALHSLLHTLLILRLPFCDNGINHLFCDIPPLLKLSCEDTYLNETVLFTVSGVFVGLGPLMFILISYVKVVSAVFKMASAVAIHKVFSTCAAHLIIVTVFYGTGSFNYMRPKSSYSLERDKLASVVYNVMTPMLNPIIYSLRNGEVKRSLRNILRRLQFSRKR